MSAAIEGSRSYVTKQEAAQFPSPSCFFLWYADEVCRTSPRLVEFRLLQTSQVIDRHRARQATWSSPALSSSPPERGVTHGTASSLGDLRVLLMTTRPIPKVGRDFRTACCHHDSAARRRWAWLGGEAPRTSRSLARSPRVRCRRLTLSVHRVHAESRDPGPRDRNGRERPGHSVTFGRVYAAHRSRHKGGARCCRTRLTARTIRWPESHEPPRGQEAPHPPQVVFVNGVPLYIEVIKMNRRGSSKLSNAQPARSS